MKTRVGRYGDKILVKCSDSNTLTQNEIAIENAGTSNLVNNKTNVIWFPSSLDEKTTVLFPLIGLKTSATTLEEWGKEIYERLVYTYIIDASYDDISKDAFPMYTYKGKNYWEFNRHELNFPALGDFYWKLAYKWEDTMDLISTQEYRYFKIFITEASKYTLWNAVGYLLHTYIGSIIYYSKDYISKETLNYYTNIIATLSESSYSEYGASTLLQYLLSDFMLSAVGAYLHANNVEFQSPYYNLQDGITGVAGYVYNSKIKSAKNIIAQTIFPIRHIRKAIEIILKYTTSNGEVQFPANAFNNPTSFEDEVLNMGIIPQILGCTDIEGGEEKIKTIIKGGYLNLPINTILCFFAGFAEDEQTSEGHPGYVVTIYSDTVHILDLEHHKEVYTDLNKAEKLKVVYNLLAHNPGM